MADKKISALTAATTPLAGTEVVPLVQSGVTKKVAISDLTAGRAVSTGALTASGNLRTEYSAAGNVSVIANNTNTTAGAASQVIALNDASRGLRIQYSSSGGFGGNAIVNGVSTEAGQIFTDNGFPLVLGVGGFATAILDTSSNFNIKSGNLIIGTAGKGIDFSADPSAAGMTSELLDDYEEGTWTPAFDQFTVGNGSVTGTYTKIGRVVTVIANLTFGSTSSWAGTCTAISNLPFTSAARSVGLITFFRAGTGWYTGSTVLNSGVANTVYPSRYDNTSISATTPFTWAASDYLVLQMTYEA